MDYIAWLHRLQQFVAACRANLPPDRHRECSVHVDPPLSASDLQRLRDGLDCPLPDSVAGFLTQAASRLRFECVCPADDEEVYISGELFNYYLWRPDDNSCSVGCPDGMIESRECVLDYVTAETSWLNEPEWVLDRAFWRHGLPLTQSPNTDCLALWAHDPDGGEPAVVSLAHDEESYLLSPSFDTFLEQWESLGYDFAPEYIDPDLRLLDTSCDAARERRRLLGLDRP